MTENLNKIQFTASSQNEFAVELVVTQGDITPYGSASFINYVRWYGIARDALLQWRHLGFEEVLKSRVEIEVFYCNIQYKQQAMLQDEIIIKTNAANFRNQEFTLLFTLIKKETATLISLGKQQIRFRDSKTHELFELPQALLKDTLGPIEVDESSMLFKF